MKAKAPSLQPRTKSAGGQAVRARRHCETQLHLRVSSKDKLRIERAAQLRHQNVSAFVLQACRAAADEVLGDQTRFVLSPDQHAAFQAAIEAPARDLPALRELFKRGSVLV